jgi:hypothetical protein
MRADQGDLQEGNAFLLIGKREKSSWSLALAEALVPLGRLHIVCPLPGKGPGRSYRLEHPIISANH